MSQVLQKRSFRLDENAGYSASRTWFDGNTLATQLLNAYTILVPAGEHFIIRTCSRYIERTSPELRAELEILFYQEGSHAREHRI